MVASVIRHPALPWECALGMDNGSQVRHQFRALVRVSGCQYCHHWGITLYPQQDIHDLTLRCGWWQHLVSCSSCKRHVSGISLAISTYSSSRILFISFGGIDPDWNWENFIGMLIDSWERDARFECDRARHGEQQTVQLSLPLFQECFIQDAKIPSNASMATLIIPC